MQKQDEQLLSLRIEITVVIKVLPVIHTVSSINHLIYLALAKILLLLLPLGLAITKMRNTSEAIPSTS